MIDPSNRVFTNVLLYVRRKYPNVHGQNTHTVTPEKLPSISVVQQDCSEVALDLSPGDPTVDYSVRSNIEIQTYSASSPTEAKEIMTEACAAMRGMAYTRISGPYDISQKTRPNFYRYVARFNRIVSDLSEIPRFQFDDDTNNGGN